MREMPKQTYRILTTVNLSVCRRYAVNAYKSKSLCAASHFTNDKGRDVKCRVLHKQPTHKKKLDKHYAPQRGVRSSRQRVTYTLFIYLSFCGIYF